MELTIKDYALHRSTSITAVRKAIKAGRITLNKNNKLDPNIADRQWLDNTDPAKQRKEINEANETTGKAIFHGPNYHQSRAIKEAYNARLTKLQFEKESKKLISVDEVKISAFNAGRMVRDRILNIPDRVIPNLIGKTNIFEMKEILKAELIKALEELSKSPY
jgi:hypothetical protein